MGVLKVATTESGMVGLRRENDVLNHLVADEELGDWRAVVPVPLDSGAAGGGAFLLTSRLPGRDGREVLADAPAARHIASPPAARHIAGAPAARRAPAVSDLTSAAFHAITPLHRRNQTVQVVDDAMLSRWVDEPADQIRRALRVSGAVDRLAGILCADLAGRPMTLGWTHGDLHPGNVLVSADGKVTGIVDWGEARERDLAVLDLAFWLLTLPAPGQPREFGKRIAARLDSERFWTPAERRLLDGATYGDLVTGRTLLLLAWLRHVASNLAKSDRYAKSPLWSRRNVVPVLRQVAYG
jgi:aminoglycoside phosphotransferase (APT) family kinase protein